ncbi:MAG TPA: protein translocase SEC61 complex subunit gamma [Candidatus Bilamarchaeaceae archaeon]|nr:protein translocase SEC61 complex subunit gamma [Candidatus Bilamarchaeaceae archaeon]
MEIRELLVRCGRILKISKKPTDEEFEKVAKITSLGIAAIGMLGVILSVIFSWI